MPHGKTPAARCRLPGLALLAALLAAAGARAVTNVFEYPLVFRQHQTLTIEFQRAIRARDAAEMERVCRAGAALLPGNGTWRYNLACALALQKRAPEALVALDEAIDRGYREADAIAADDDLAALRGLPAFRGAVDRARRLARTPVPGQPVVAPTAVTGGVALVSASNTLWDFDLGRFRAFFLPPTNPPAPSALAAAWMGPAADLVRPWLASNAAAGNWGDFYDNRDRGHSRPDTTAFPGLATIAYGDDARRHNADYTAAAFLFNGAVVGNSSLAITGGPYWRSLPRETLGDGFAVGFLFAQYLNNHLYVYPSHRDCDPAGLGDLFVVNQPYLVISRGSSGSDLPFVRAAFAALAAFRPETKRFLVARGLLMPTVQMLLRASQKGVDAPADYLSGRAHPTAFDAADLDVARLVALAHALGTNDIPPLVALRVTEDHPAVSGVDFFDLAPGDALYDTPCAVARVLRSVAHRRTMTVGAQMNGAADPAAWRLRWVVLHGDTRKVLLLPLRPDHGQVEISVAHPGGRFPAVPGQPLLASRLDVGVFATNGRQHSAPSFVSFFALDNERRRYADDGRILSVDYAVAATNYVDPVLSLPKHWRDEYRYDAEKRLTGWTRRRGDVSEDFSPRGERVEQADALGRPTVTRTVSYIPRSTPGGSAAPDLVQVDGGFRVRYRYTSDADFTGEVAGRERVGP
jgi:hypothetical protein